MLSKQQKGTAPPEQPEGFVFPRTIGHHGHNMFLQAFHELGAVGALLLAIAGAAVVMLIPLLPAAAQPFAGGAFAAFALVGAFAWGMWQSWFMCAVGLLPLYLRVGAAACEARENAPFSSAPSCAPLHLRPSPELIRAERTLRKLTSAAMATAV